MKTEFVDPTALPVNRDSKSITMSMRYCGMINLLALMLLVPLTFGIAVVTPFDSRSPEEIAVLQAAVDHIPLLSPSHVETLKDFLAGNSFLQSRWVSSVAFVLPVLVATVCMLFVLGQLVRQSSLVVARDVDVVQRFGIAFAALTVLQYPMFTQDFWYSVAWGRMLASGVNPYYHYFTVNSMTDLPLYYAELHMTYGPLWAWIAATLALVTNHAVIWEYIAFKLLLLAAWIASLLVIRRIVVRRSFKEQTIALLLFGWMPLTYFLSIAEGHNDVIMVLPMMLWFYAVSQGRHLHSPWALVTSVLIKYVTLPLVAVELWRGWITMRGRRLAYTGVLAATAAATALCVLPLAHNLDFLTATRQMQKWHMLTPANALFHVSNWLHLSISGRVFSVLVLVMLRVLFVYYLVPTIRQFDFDKLVTTILSGFLIVLLVVVGHVWPWFVLWVLAPAVIAPRSLAKDIAIALAIAAPFVHVYWIWGHEWAELKYATVAYYATVSGMLLITRWYRGHQPRPALSRT